MKPGQKHTDAQHLHDVFVATGSTICFKINRISSEMAKVLSQKQQPVLINVLSGFTQLKWPPSGRHHPVLMDDLFG